MSRSDATWENVRTIFYSRVSAKESELLKSRRTSQLVPLRAAVGNAVWARFLFFLKDWVAVEGRRPRRKQPQRPATDSSTLTPPSLSEGVELPMDAPALRLRGRVDRLERVGHHTWGVYDVKTGRFADKTAIREEHFLQVRLYALMAEEKAPGVKLRLYLEVPALVEVPWGAEERRVTRAWLKSVLDRLPPDTEVRAHQLAQPGKSCGNCRIRHLCQTYIATAPHWWQGSATKSSRPPLDIWGSVLEISDHRSHGVSIRLRDAANRRVLISGLRDMHGVHDMKPGDTVWFFGLQSSEPYSPWNRMPRNFHDMPRYMNERPAAQLQVYLSPKGR